VGVAEGKADVTVSTAAFAGMRTGQKVHVLDVTDQYTSTMKRRYPTASRFDMHLSAAVSSKMPLPKHAALIDTAELVTKLIGIWPATSLSL
jgi:hypothetical protein